MAGTREVYEFGTYVLDVGERRLWNAGQIVSHAPKAHDGWWRSSAVPARS